MMIKKGSFTIVAMIVMSFIMTNIFTPPSLVAASAIPYEFLPGPNYMQSDTMAQLKIYNPTNSGVPKFNIIWKDPLGTTVECRPAGGVCWTAINEYSPNGVLISTTSEFYISGQNRFSGTYTAIVSYCSQPSYIGTSCLTWTEMFRPNFYIKSPPTATPAETPTSTPTATFTPSKTATATPKVTATPTIPSQIFISVAAQDGWVLESSETSNLGGSAYSIGPALAIGDNVIKQQYRGILSFSSGSLPDTAIIIGVALKIKKNGFVGGGDPVAAFQGFMIDIKTGFFGTFPALQATDFQDPASKTLGPASPALVNNWYSINLTNGKDYINKLATNSGLTQIRLRFKLDDNNVAVANYLSLFSGDAATATDRPQLVVTYYVP